MNDIRISNVSLAGPAVVAEQSGRAASPPQKKPDQISENVVARGVQQAPQSREEEGSREVNAKEQAKQVAEKQPDVKREQLQEAVTKLNDYIQSVQRDLHFNVDEESGRMVVKVMDRNTDEVVRQIPDELALKMARNLQQEEPLSLFTMKV